MFTIDWRNSVLTSLLLATALGATSNHTDQPVLAPYLAYSSSKIIPDSYIVKFKENHTLQNHLNWIGLNLSSIGDEIYDLDILPGYYLKGNQSLINIIRRDAGVEWVEPSSRISPPDRPPTVEDERNSQKRWHGKLDPDASFQLAMQSSAEKISPSDGSHRFWYWSEAGRNVDIYILDGGVNIYHPEFGGRASNFRGLDVSPYLSPDSPESTMADTNPDTHGTCVASLAGGNTHGIARQANIINVKIAERDGGQTAKVAQAIIDVTREHIKKKKLARRSPFAGSVINFSMDCRYNRAMEIAIRKADDAGIPVVVAAGNRNSDTFRRFPCNLRDTICVASVDKSYRKARSSNYGSEVTVAAPGQEVPCATFHGTNFSSHIDSGTSLATPYVSGTLAHFISYEKLSTSTLRVWERMLTNWNYGFLEGFPRYPATPNVFNSNGFQKQNKRITQPYVGAPDSPRL
ncbi:subtilisin-like protein [Viridothelium virens]|uniref:Subtilisin-like protein n=1 Tax=Viridothelium virens TaxID=1048519 RepID=A0A6A6GXJ1_VIRVR|nr:subtilisin-like protein [Viridothelium virens]